MKSWSDVMLFISKHHLPFNVIRFNMSLRGVLINIETGETLANTLSDAVKYLKTN